ncbi:MAG: HAMP domain-containing protein, partial [Candidatus Promineifilaceae bacterium]|nr:HAMP domain-containing protein [Candidatus Promineifilaceae bacterium]
MNRLWVRLSVVFTLVIILAVLGIGISARVNRAALNDPQTDPPPEVSAYLEQLRNRPLPIDVTTVAIVIGVIAIVGGVWLSRSLTKPLSELEEGAEAIGRQDLTHRVPVYGSKEMVAV